MCIRLQWKYVNSFTEGSPCTKNSCDKCIKKIVGEKNGPAWYQAKEPIITRMTSDKQK